MDNVSLNPIFEKTILTINDHDVTRSTYREASNHILVVTSLRVLKIPLFKDRGEH